MMNSVTYNVDKIDVDELTREFKVMNIDIFATYLKEVWRDLSQRSDDKKGVNKITFSKYYELPGIISDRLFAVFDKDQNSYLDVLEFIDGMKTLFSDSYEKCSKFIFDLYDFDKDGVISKEDIRTVLSYVPLNTQGNLSKNLKFENESFKDRVESQEELYTILEKCFKEEEVMNFTKFLTTIENNCSDIYLFILIFLLQRKPFSKSTLSEYEKQKSSFLKVSTPSPTNPNNKKLLASPNLHSKFSPSIKISKSPLITANRFVLEECDKGESVDLLSKLSGVAKPRTEKKSSTVKIINPDFSSKLTSKDKNIPVSRKDRYNLKNIKNDTVMPEMKKNYNDLPITPAVKQPKKVDKNIESFKISIEDKMIVDNDFIVSKVEEEDEFDEDEDSIKHEGHLYKLTESKQLKKLWFKLVHKDFYYFKSESDKIHQGMHNLSGVFLKEEKNQIIEGYSFYCFSVVYPKKARYYFVDNETDYKKWVAIIKRATGYSDLTDIYEVKEKLGNGKFGLVRLGIHKETGRKVAIKIMSKKDMNNQDLELVRIEIEILKICQHPNIIRLYDVFENTEYIYIIMEHCSGGDLFSYIEKRGFRLPEQRAAELVHKLCTAVYYSHSYGIAHRDLKPENILMTDSTETADIRLLDFGLSKILGPTDTCTEPYGTLSYVAPEVLLEKPYTKSVDLWSIGITTFLLLAGHLPFDHESSEREIARQTVQDPVPYTSSVWKKVSSEAKSFVDNLLQKDPSKRMKIQQVLEHPWIQKLHKTSLPEMRRKSKDVQASNFFIYSSTEEINH